MARSYRRVDRAQRMLLPPGMTEWLSEDHLVWFVLSVVEQLDTRSWHAGRRLGGVGRQGFDPDMLLALLVYGYAVGERSSRRIERLCETDVAFRVICAQDAPDHSTIARFRAEHEGAFTELFAQVLVLCARAGMGRFGTVAVDGTKIAANASRGANRREDWLRQRAGQIVAEAVEADAAEDALFGSARGEELPEKFAEAGTRDAAIRAAFAEMQRQRQARQQAAAQAQQAAEQFLQDLQAGRGRPGPPPVGMDPMVANQARLAGFERARQQATTPQRRANLGRQIRQVRQNMRAAAAAGMDMAKGSANQAPAVESSSDNGPDGRGAGQLIVNLTDPDSRLMPTKNGWIQGYNAQLAVSDDHLILAVELTQDQGDSLRFHLDDERRGRRRCDHGPPPRRRQRHRCCRGQLRLS